ncbi:hypothetical protein ACP4OV_004208 [Aristida adscensionis]
MAATPALIHVESIQTAIPARVAGAGRSLPIAVSGPPLAAAAREAAARERAAWAKESLSAALADHPVMAGRLCRRHGGDGDGVGCLWEVKLMVTGVRLVQASVEATIEAFLVATGEDRERKEAALALWNEIDLREPDICAPFIMQLTRFQDGGYAIGASCSLLLADPLCLINFGARIRPGSNFTYRRFAVAGQDGTLWWHAHVASLRGTLRGVIVVRPRRPCPFPKPHRDVPVVIGEWREMDEELDRKTVAGILGDDLTGAMINGKLGDLYNCSAKMGSLCWTWSPAGKTYMLRVINAALFSEYYLKIVGHKFTVVGADANYVLHGRPGQPAAASRHHPKVHDKMRRAYAKNRSPATGDVPPSAPEMPDEHNMITSFSFHGNLTGLRRRGQPLVPTRVEERLFVTVGLGSVC